MPGAHDTTRRVTVVNANWDAGAPGGDGSFSLLLVDEDGNRHTVQPSPAAMTALVALTQAGTVLLWDPDGGTLIASNVVGQWLPSTWSATDRERR
jgi:hypothetical protein